MPTSAHTLRIQTERYRQNCSLNKIFIWNYKQLKNFHVTLNLECICINNTLWKMYRYYVKLIIAFCMNMYYVLCTSQNKTMFFSVLCWQNILAKYNSHPHRPQHFWDISLDLNLYVMIYLLVVCD